MKTRTGISADPREQEPCHDADASAITEADAPEFFTAVRAGKLREYLLAEPATGNAVLYRVVSDVAYERLTRAVERRRGHRSCQISVHHLEPDCHDRHQDDVAAVRADLLRHADQPIENLQGWLVSRLKPVTIDAYRARRGAVGAQQRPRLPLPRWLDDRLGRDPWLAWLAVGILTWVGVPVTPANGLWPLGAWADRRAEATGLPCTEAQVAGDVERVLAAMRHNPGWYERYVERPLGHKQAPLLSSSRGNDPDGAYRDGVVSDRGFLPLVDPSERVDSWLRDVAAKAIAATQARVEAGAALRPAFISVLSELAVDGASLPDMDLVPDTAPDVAEMFSRALADPATVERIADALMEILYTGTDVRRRRT